jgi:hypothetical protein
MDSAGNTDGILTWRLGTLERDRSAREVVLFTYAESLDAVVQRLDAIRQKFAALPCAPMVPADVTSLPHVWIENSATDFVLHGPAFFRWDWTKRQSLRSTRGGQLSQFTWYIHYRDASGEHRAGAPHFESRTPENVRVAEPMRKLSQAEAIGVVEAADDKLRVRVYAVMGDGPGVVVEFSITNLGTEPLCDVRLTTYANIESAHDEANDFSFFDARTSGLLV